MVAAPSVEAKLSFIGHNATIACLATLTKPLKRWTFEPPSSTVALCRDRRNGRWSGGEDSPALFTCFTGWSSPPDHPPRWVSWTVGVLEYWSIPFHKIEWDITVRDLLARQACAEAHVSGGGANNFFTDWKFSRFLPTDYKSRFFPIYVNLMVFILWRGCRRNFLL